MVESCQFDAEDVPKITTFSALASEARLSVGDRPQGSPEPSGLAGGERKRKLAWAVADRAKPDRRRQFSTERTTVPRWGGCAAGAGPMSAGVRSASGRRDSNPQHSAWKAETLAIELRPRCCRSSRTIVATFVSRGGCRLPPRFARRRTGRAPAPPRCPTTSRRCRRPAPSRVRGGPRWAHRARSGTTGTGE